MFLHCDLESLSPHVNMENEPQKLVAAQGTGGNQSKSSETRAQLVPSARLFALDHPSQACATFSIFSWHLFFAIFFYKSKLKVTWGQCGRKVFIQVRQEHGSSFSSFFTGPLYEDDVGELQGILGADVCE